MRRLALFALLAGCNDNLPIASFVDKLRVLAIQASPAEVAPGEVARLSPLVVGGTGALSALWLACRTDPTAPSTHPCGIDELDGSALPDACGAQANGATCALDDQLYTTVTAAGSLVGSDGTGQLLVTLVVADTGSAADCYLGTLKNSGLPTEPDHCVIAYKRVSLATTPTNHNPEIAGFTFTEKGGAVQSLLTGEATASLSSSTKHRTTDTLGMVRADDAAEVEADGSYENLALSWFTDAGAIDGGRSSFDPPSCGSQTQCAMKEPLTSATTDWKAPTADERTTQAPDGRVRFWAVLRDDRGGVGWRSGALTLTP